MGEYDEKFENIYNEILKKFNEKKVKFEKERTERKKKKIAMFIIALMIGVGLFILLGADNRNNESIIIEIMRYFAAGFIFICVLVLPICIIEITYKGYSKKDKIIFKNEFSKLISNLFFANFNTKYVPYLDEYDEDLLNIIKKSNMPIEDGYEFNCNEKKQFTKIYLMFRKIDHPAICDTFFLNINNETIGISDLLDYSYKSYFCISYLTLNTNKKYDVKFLNKNLGLVGYNKNNITGNEEFDKRFATLTDSDKTISELKSNGILDLIGEAPKNINFDAILLDNNIYFLFSVNNFILESKGNGLKINKESFYLHYLIYNFIINFYCKATKLL